MIEFKDVNKIYHRRIAALRNIDFKINNGEFVTIVGPSGAGKSTLVKLIICEEKPSSGKILVGGYDITQLTQAEIPYYRRKIGFVFQDYKLLPAKTVYENVSFALEVCGLKDSVIKGRVPKILKIVGLQRRMNSMPVELSGGEKQRVALARALVHHPKLLIADEPTGNLDPKTAFGIIELLVEINKLGTIVLLTTHNRDIVDALGRRVIHIKAGQIASDEEKGRYKL
jgi:cell division transport system ATP-binding protein